MFSHRRHSARLGHPWSTSSRTYGGGTGRQIGLFSSYDAVSQAPSAARRRRWRLVIQLRARRWAAVAAGLPRAPNRRSQAPAALVPARQDQGHGGLPQTWVCRCVMNPRLCSDRLGVGRPSPTWTRWSCGSGFRPRHANQDSTCSELRRTDAERCPGGWIAVARLSGHTRDRQDRCRTDPCVRPSSFPKAKKEAARLPRIRSATTRTSIAVSAARQRSRRLSARTAWPQAAAVAQLVGHRRRVILKLE